MPLKDGEENRLGSLVLENSVTAIPLSVVPGELAVTISEPLLPPLAVTPRLPALIADASAEATVCGVLVWP